jgi:DNA-binding transcriptional ArsR family regulator
VTESSGREKTRGADTQSLDLVFSALSNPTRRAILARLSEKDWTVTELAAPFDMSLPAISKHLQILEDAGIISKTREGRVHHCRLEPAPLAKAASWLGFYERMWNRQLDSLADLLGDASRGAED